MSEQIVELSEVRRKSPIPPRTPDRVHELEIKNRRLQGIVATLLERNAGLHARIRELEARG